MGKYGAVEDPVCAVLRHLRELEALGRMYEAALDNLDVDATPLTLAAASRPVSEGSSRASGE
jgi:hypothetical protein